MTEQETSKDFFISYNKADRAWAEWIAWLLQAEGYSVVLQAWDFRPGGNFLLQMHEAAKQCKRTIAVLSPNYLDPQAEFSQIEWAATLVQDPKGKDGKLIPVRVRECTPDGVLAAITYIDLVGLNAVEAQKTLIGGIRFSRNLPTLAPSFPGQTPVASSSSPSFPGEWPVVWTVPYTRNPFFTGRDDLLNRLHTQLATSKPTALTPASAISGLGGIGKTQTALEYAHRFGHEYRYVLWVSAVSAESLLSGFVQLATLLQVPGQNVQDPQKTAETVKGWLAQQRDWLLILDNADDLALASQYFPQGNRMQGHILLTTRASSGGALVQILEVEKMDATEGVELLLRRVRQVTADAPLVRVNTRDRADAEAIVVAVDGLPLAIDQAGAYIEENNISLSAYLNLYHTRRKYLLSKRGQFPPGHPETVATTWSLSFQLVEQANPAAAELLRLCAFLAPDVIPETILTKGATALGEVLELIAEDPIQLNEAIQVLRRYSLLRRNRETETLSLHRLVQATIQDELSPEAQHQWAERAVHALSKVFPFVDYGTWRKAQPYLSHADVCQSLIERYNLDSPEAALLLSRYGVYFYYAGKYKLAEPLYQRALYIEEQFPDPEHLYTANTLHDLATLYRDQGKYEQVELLYQRALYIYEQVSDSEHLYTATTLYELASLYLVQRRYEEAESFYQRALHIYEQALGSEHLYTTATLHALATLYQAQGKDEQAELLYQQVLHTYKQTIGIDHPSNATTLYNLAILYQDQGKDEQAEPFYQHALSINEQALGIDHPEVAKDLEGYANLLHGMKRTDEARRLEARAKKIRDKHSS